MESHGDTLAFVCLSTECVDRFAPSAVRSKEEGSFAPPTLCLKGEGRFALAAHAQSHKGGGFIDRLEFSLNKAQLGDRL